MARILEDMTKDERGLLLFFEAGAVDHRGTVHSQHMNKDDFNIVKNWEADGFVRFGRIPMIDIQGRFNNKKTHWVIMSDEAFALAHQERLARVKRMGQYGINGKDG